jgi:hypothetical protein
MYAKGDQQDSQRGFSLFDMKRYLENHGSRPMASKRRWTSSSSASGHRVVNENGYNHFVVIKGLRDGRVLVGDPSGGTRALTQQAFAGLWTNGILFVVSNRQDQARFNLAAEWSALPRAPLASGISREGLSALVLPKAGPSDF